MHSAALVGREGDLRLLHSALLVARGGETRTVVVGGEAGIGKTRLVAEFAAEVADGAVIVRGQCVDLDSDAPPYAPVIAALRGLSASVGTEGLRAAAGPGGASLGVLLPELRVEPEPFAGGGAEQLFDAVATALENLARERPIVLVIEDLHWADPATVGLLRFVVRVLERARIVVVLTYRSDELGRAHPFRGLLAELDRSRRAE